MRIETYGQLDLFLFEIADMERKIAHHVALRDHVEASGKLSPEMDALFASILAPLTDAVAARKAALDALSWEERLRLAEEEQERMGRRETSTEEEEDLKREIAILREIRRCEDEICAAWWQRYDGRLTPQQERWEREAQARMEELQTQL